MFEPGQFVVCVNDDLTTDAVPPPGGSWLWKDGLHGLTRGAVYTVRFVGRHWYCDHPCLWLVEIIRPPNPCDPGEVGFDARRFRPLPDKRLTVFKQMLVPTELERLEIISEDIADDIVELEKAWRK